MQARTEVIEGAISIAGKPCKISTNEERHSKMPPAEHAAAHAERGREFMQQGFFEQAENVLALGSLWQEPTVAQSDTVRDSSQEPHHCKPHPQAAV